MLIVHQSIVEPFLRRFTEELAKLKVGMPWEKGVSITPLPEPGKVDYMTELVEDAEGQGSAGRQRGRRQRRPAPCSIRRSSIRCRRA